MMVLLAVKTGQAKEKRQLELFPEMKIRWKKECAMALQWAGDVREVQDE